MKKKFLLGTLIGFAAGTAAAIAGKIAVDKVTNEIRSEMSDVCFPSPDGDHLVTLSGGSSKTAKGLSAIRVTVTSESVEDSCKLLLLTKTLPQTYDAVWSDNGHFRLLIGSGKRRQCCDVTIEDGTITANYYLAKDC